ncbi:MAG TPA: phosphoenolpyruvate carboxykinase (ATP), partial [Paenibacillaceae bacterium]|nr:phosphoenolpyruvate carboxykinase (ATP) [Paenibacillaceae bacterium]
MDTKTSKQLNDILNSENIRFNLSVAELVEKAVTNNGSKLTSTGAISSKTGKYTGRSPKDKFIVDEPSVHDKVDWGSTNRPFTPEKFEKLYQDVLNYLDGKELFVFDGYAGADQTYRLPIRVVNEYAWHNLFARQLFVRPTEDELNSHQAEFTVVSAPDFEADPEVHGTNSEAFIIVNFAKKIVFSSTNKYDFLSKV